MILNACYVLNKMVDEKECKNCTNTYCRHAGQLTTAEKVDQFVYGDREYWEGEKDEKI